MDEIIYIGANKYSNLKADLMTKNKIDMISFDTKRIIKDDIETVSDFEFKIYKVENNVLKPENDNVIDLSKDETASKWIVIWH